MSEYFQNFNHLIKVYIQCTIQNSQTSERFCCLLYMHQLDGFDDKLGRVLKLHQAIYSLKQSGRSWYKKLMTVLFNDGFTQSHTDDCVFYKKTGDRLSIITIYMNTPPLHLFPPCGYPCAGLRPGWKVGVQHWLMRPRKIVFITGSVIRLIRSVSAVAFEYDAQSQWLHFVVERARTQRAHHHPKRASQTCHFERIRGPTNANGRLWIRSSAR